VIATGDRIQQETTNPRIRKRVLLWQIRIVPAVQEAAFLSDPKEAFVTVNGQVVAMRQYLTLGDGAQVFGPQQPLAIEAALRLEEDFYEIAGAFMDEDEVARLRSEFDAFDPGRQISGTTFTLPNVEQQMQEARASGRFDWVVATPLSPFRALEGVGSGPAAIRDFNDTALRFASIVESMPQHMR